ncbi:transcriptional repressor [Candidatus Peregrinibacteria bacterium]|nr:transcriptional repressor [Candidatus Peregrinibacteria bacterium]
MKIKDLQSELESNGVYFTHLVKELIYALMKAKKPLSIIELREIFKGNGYCPNPTSIYRQLNRMSGLGFVEESLFADGIKRFCFIYNKNHHHHFECNKCGYIENVPMKTCSEVARGVSNRLKRSGHKITSHSFTLKGLCSKCVCS